MTPTQRRILAHARVADLVRMADNFATACQTPPRIVIREARNERTALLLLLLAQERQRSAKLVEAMHDD